MGKWLEHLAPVRCRSILLRSFPTNAARRADDGLERDAPATDNCLAKRSFVHSQPQPATHRIQITLNHSPKDHSAYRGMLKATSALASAKLVTIGISVVRTKVLALLLGPAGMGAINVVTSSLDLARVLFSCGLDGATVRQVASGAGGDDPGNLDHVYRIAARTAVILGTAAAVVFACVSPIVAGQLLGDAGLYWWFIVGGASLVFTPLLGVQLAFLQGIKQSKSLAVCQVVASVAGALLNILLVVLFGRTGAILALLPVVLTSLTVHHRFVRKFRPPTSTSHLANFPSEFRNLLKLGSAFAVNGIWLTAAGWLNIFFLTRYFGPANAPVQIGLHGAASMLANFYIGILISSMSTEFYPRLIEAATDKPRLNELLNQQTRLSMAIGIPISAGMLLSAPLMLGLLYSKDFVVATDLMRWLMVGMTLRFVSCPIGFSLFAIGGARLIATSELLMGLVTISLSYTMIRWFGLTGVGIALVSANFLYLLGVAWVMHTRGIAWSFGTIKIVVGTLLVLAVCLALLLTATPLIGIVVAGVLLGGLSLRHLMILKHDTQMDLRHLLRKLTKRH